MKSKDQIKALATLDGWNVEPSRAQATPSGKENMNEPKTPSAEQSGGSLKRVVRPCRCEFQKKSDWGYQLFEWVGEPKYWRPYARHRRFPLEEAERRARKYKHVLISCGGCGADIVREYGPVWCMSPRTPGGCKSRIAAQHPKLSDPARRG